MLAWTLVIAVIAQPRDLVEVAIVIIRVHHFQILPHLAIINAQLLGQQIITIVVQAAHDAVIIVATIAASFKLKLIAIYEAITGVVTLK